MKQRLSLGLFLVAAALAALTFLPNSAGASTASNTLSITAAVSQNCVVAAQTLAFGSYDPIVTNASGGADKTASAVLTFNCTKGSTAVYVTADQGLNHANASGTTRAMNSGSNYLSYELYTDSGHTNVWNTTNNGTNDYQPTFTSGSSATATVYGDIPKGQSPAVGASYSDSVTMTINF